MVFSSKEKNMQDGWTDVTALETMYTDIDRALGVISLKLLEGNLSVGSLKFRSSFSSINYTTLGTPM